MEKNISILNFTNLYKSDDFLEITKNHRFLDLSGLNGTNCICDDIAKENIKNLITENNIKADSIHIIDNGNYHYMSAIFGSLIDFPFNLIYFDNHPDMKESFFGSVLSCGSWVKNLKSENKNLRNVFAIGINETLYEEIDDADKENVTRIYGDYEDIIEELRMCGAFNYPIYLSIDKDVLDKKYIDTNWDQGCMDDSTLLDSVRFISSNSNLIGVDICGGPLDDGISLFEDSQKQNKAFDLKLLERILIE